MGPSTFRFGRGQVSRKLAVIGSLDRRGRRDDHHFGRRAGLNTLRLMRAPSAQSIWRERRVRSTAIRKTINAGSDPELGITSHERLM